MRFLFLSIILGSFMSCNASTTQTTSTAAEVTKVEESKKEEDCDDKAKKKIEIKEETISLTGNTGCTLEEAGAKPQ
jgi:hypothetical protein